MTTQTSRRAAHRRVAALILIAAIALLAPSDVARADPPGPTDYRTTVLAIEPDTPAISVEMIGGDSFVQLTVDRGTEVIVLGYNSEPYLRFGADGTVEENRQSPTVAANEDRFGSVSSAAGDPTAPPEWTAVAHDGTYAWHDHRAHWMSEDDPPGYERGDRIQDGEIDLEVDGQPVRVLVTTTWLEAPSNVPLATGAIVGVFAFLIVLSTGRRIAWALIAAGAAAAATGWVQVESVPSVTGPSDMAWILPVAAAASALLAVVLGRSVVSHALVLLAGIELALWVVLRRDVLTRAVIPTDAPYWLDRAVTSGAAVVAALVVVASTIAMFRVPAPE